MAVLFVVFSAVLVGKGAQHSARSQCSAPDCRALPTLRPAVCV